MKSGRDWVFLDADRLTTFLGWFSIALGVAEVVDAAGVARLTGMAQKRRGLLRFVGAREIVTGLGILSKRRADLWIWSRVVGDLMDLALLRAAASDRKSNSGRLKTTAAAATAVTGIDLLSGIRLSTAMEPTRVKERIIINRNPSDLYSFWREFTHLPSVMSHLESVEVISDRTSRWRVGDAGFALEWEAEIADDRPGEIIAWHSIKDSEIDTKGSVRFEPLPGRRGTVLSLDMQYSARERSYSAPVVRFLEYMSRQSIGNDLRRFKQIMETGEVSTTQGQSSGRRDGASWLDFAARA